MRQSRFSEDAIIGILKEHAAVASAPVMLHQGANGRFRKAAPHSVRIFDRPVWAGFVAGVQPIRPPPLSAYRPKSARR